jgi:hypothetical protein
MVASFFSVLPVGIANKEEASSALVAADVPEINSNFLHTTKLVLLNCR